VIRELSITNYALINELTVVFKQGFSVFTGETGAGKSILIGAIGLLLGERASSEQIRSGTEETEIHGIFELDTLQPALSQILSAGDIPCEDNTLIVRRIISKSGRNRVHINQIPVPLATLKAVGNHLIDFHGQHEHQSLLRPETATFLINNLSKVKTHWEKFTASYEEHITAKTELADFDRNAAELAQKMDFIEFQYNELYNLQLQPDEEPTLEEEYSLLSSATERCACVSNIIDIIEGNTETEALERNILRIQKNLETLRKFDPSAAPWNEDLESSITFFSELSSFCNSYLQRSDTAIDPAQLDHINSRLARIQRLKKKYNCSCNDLITKQHHLKDQLDALENTNADRSLLEKKTALAENTCRENALQLSTARKKEAQSFDIKISQYMGRLGFSGGKWRTVFIPENVLSPNGLEQTVFEVRTNQGEPFLSLIKTASGGEISRLMLAIKTVLAAQDSIPILIFDEIDAGIGGILAKEVAQSMYALSQSHQVICISHLHQIASIADHHYRVFKETEEDRTVTKVYPLTDQDKVEEISRMLGSDSTITRKHAEELLATFSNKQKF